MASYFDEHNCTPLAEGETPNHTLHMARLLQDGGFLEEFEELFGQIQASPPASKEVLEKLPEKSVSNIIMPCFQEIMNKNIPFMLMHLFVPV